MRASITRITNRLRELEGKADQPTTLDIAQRMLQKLDTLEAEFKTHHYALIDLIDGDDDLREEQELLDRHDDEMSTLVVRTQQLITACNSSSHSAAHKIASWKLKLLQSGLASLHSITEETTDICLLQQYQEQAGDIKKELGDFRNL